MSTMDSQLVQRNASLSDLVTVLREQQAAKPDVVVPAAGLRSSAGRWEIDDTGPAVLDPDGVTTGPGSLGDPQPQPDTTRISRSYERPALGIGHPHGPPRSRRGETPPDTGQARC